MSEFVEVRHEFYRRCATEGWSHLSEVSGQWPVPPARWLGRFYRPASFEYTRQRRLVNHFAVGADPEFVFLLPGGSGAFAAATKLGLKAGQAFGADNNGRLVELRPAPSRFALGTLASMWSTLKWLSLLVPASNAYAWRAGAFINDDGLGGHIHFGRKRGGLQPREIAALDTLSFYLFQSGIWDAAEGKLRIRAAKGGGNHGYGRLGDKRDQPYGYEYRTMPSWLCSPWMAYLALVLAKLAVHDPQLLPPLDAGMEKLTATQIKARLRAILAFYKGLDDDTALAYSILERNGWPVWSVTDFKPAWGILPNPPGVHVQVWPRQVLPAPGEEQALATAMLSNTAPQLVTLEPNWHHLLPRGYKEVLERLDTHHAPGFGELFAGLATYTGDAVGWGYAPNWRGGEDGWVFPRDYADNPTWRAAFERQAPGVQFRTADLLYCGARECDNAHRAASRRFLESGLFPYWPVETVRAESYKEWADKWLQPPKPAAPMTQFSRLLDAGEIK